MRGGGRCCLYLRRVVCVGGVEKLMSDSETRLGDPMDLPKKEVAEPHIACPVEPILRREGDSGLGTPEFEPEEFRNLTEDEEQAYQAEVEEKLRLKAETMLFDLEQGKGVKLPRSVSRICSVALMVAATVLGLFLVTEVVQFVVTVQALPTWGQWLATAGLILFGGFLAFVVSKIIMGAVRLHQSPQINVESINILAERQRMQRIVGEKQADARNLLEKYLKNYPVKEKDRRRMRSAGMSEKEWERLLSEKDHLLSPSYCLSSGDWLDDFKTGFQEILDDVAMRRIKQYARRVGVGTAASPSAFVDQMIVFYGSTAIVKDLFLIYHLRPAFGQTGLILARSVVQTYFSGVVGEMAEDAVDVTTDFVGAGAGGLAGTVGHAFASKAAEASLNGYLLYRLGRRAMQQLQPIRTK